MECTTRVRSAVAETFAEVDEALVRVTDSANFYRTGGVVKTATPAEADDPVQRHRCYPNRPREDPIRFP